MIYETQIDYYTFYMSDEPLPDDADPFHIHLKVTLNIPDDVQHGDNGEPIDMPLIKSGRAICNHIVCSDCYLQSTCKDGANLSRAAINAALDTFPEAFI